MLKDKMTKTKTEPKKTKSNGQKERTPREAQRNIVICLNCTKPANECKGNCWGDY